MDTTSSKVATGCRNPERGEICLCPVNDGDLRSVLSRPFINTWLGKGLTSAANALASDPRVSEDRLWRMIFTLEEEANGAMELWRSCQ
jgi:hypothetical protein